MKEEGSESWIGEVKSSWLSFLSVALRPGIVIPFLVALGLIVTSYVEKLQPGAVSAILTFIISIFSGVIGAVGYKHWNDLNEERVLIARGKSAIRGLILLTQSISALEQRIRAFLGGENKSEQTLTGYEELLDRFGMLQEQTLSAIEEWKDIIPEAAIKTQIGLITRLKNEKLDLEGQVSEIQKELAATRATEDKSGQEVKDLQQRLKATEENLIKVRSALVAKAFELGSSGVSGYPGLGGLMVGIPGYTATGNIFSSFEHDRDEQLKMARRIESEESEEEKEVEKQDTMRILEYLRKQTERVTSQKIANELGLEKRRVVHILLKLIPEKVSRETDETATRFYRLMTVKHSPAKEDSGGGSDSDQR
jgi:hypothetical protein